MTPERGCRKTARLQRPSYRRSLPTSRFRRSRSSLSPATPRFPQPTSDRSSSTPRFRHSEPRRIDPTAGFDAPEVLLRQRTQGSNALEVLRRRRNRDPWRWKCVVAGMSRDSARWKYVFASPAGEPARFRLAAAESCLCKKHVVSTQDPARLARSHIKPDDADDPDDVSPLAKIPTRSLRKETSYTYSHLRGFIVSIVRVEGWKLGATRSPLRPARRARSRRCRGGTSSR